MVASGGYSTSAELTNSNGITVEGATPMPVITSSANSVGLLLSGADSTVSHLEIQDTGGGEAVFADGTGALINQVIATAESSGSTTGACVIDGSDALLRDSLCTNSGGAGVLADSVADNAAIVDQLRNVTAIGATYGVVSLTGGYALDVEVVNTIAQGHTDDLFATSMSDGDSTLDLYDSDYSTSTRVGGFINDDGGNQTRAPDFVGAASGNYHEAPGSPTIDAGENNAANGAEDLDGSPRTVGSSTDVGAYEYNPPAVTTDAATSVTTSAAQLNGTIDSHGLGGTAQFEFGPTTAYGSVIPLGPIVAGTGGNSLSHTLPGLAAGTTFHYRIDFIYGSTTFSGGDQTFMTAPPPVPPFNTALPQISGTTKVGATLSCSSGAWSGTPRIVLSYQWLRNGTQIAGPTSSSYTTTAADATRSIACRVTATNSAGAAQATSPTIAMPALPACYGLAGAAAARCKALQTERAALHRCARIPTGTQSLRRKHAACVLRARLAYQHAIAIIGCERIRNARKRAACITAARKPK
jgi:hypothetical protein